MDFIYPESVSFSCTMCGLCCGDTNEKKRHILMLSEEVNLISERIGKNSFNFSNINKNQPPYLYEMKKDEKGACIFLSGNKCDIYSVRPLICRFYPFELIDLSDGKYEFLFTNECPGIAKGEKMRRGHFIKLFLLACSKFKIL